MRNSALLATTLGLALAAFAVACSDDDTSNTNNPGGSTDTDGGTLPPGTVLPDGGVVPEDPPIYAIAQYVTTGTPTTYVTVSDTLAAEVPTAGASIEAPGQAIINGVPGGKRIFLGIATDAKLRRYDMTADGKLPAYDAPSAEVDFQAAGLPNLSGYGSGIQLVGTTKGYWLSWSGGKVVAFDQNEMIITKTIDVPEIIRANPDTPGTPYTTSVTGYPILDGTTLYYFVSWDSRNGGVIKTASGSAVVAIDTTNDTVQVIQDLDGCSYARDGVISGD